MNKLRNIHCELFEPKYNKNNGTYPQTESIKTH